MCVCVCACVRACVRMCVSVRKWDTKLAVFMETEKNQEHLLLFHAMTLVTPFPIFHEVSGFLTGLSLLRAVVNRRENRGLS